jgi:FAD/FMN-containing dehydrogenase
MAVAFERLKDAGIAARTVLASDLLPNTLDLLDGETARAVGIGVPGGGGAWLMVGFDGLPEQVEWQSAELGRLTAPLGGHAPRRLTADAWARLAEGARAAFDTPAAVMKLAVLPAQVAEVMEHGAAAARARGLGTAWSAHAGVGVVSAALASSTPEPAVVAPIGATLAEWRAIAGAGGGHATLEWAPLAVKAQVPVWDDAGAAGRIMQRIKAQLDPHNILNPGRFIAGI